MTIEVVADVGQSWEMLASGLTASEREAVGRLGSERRQRHFALGRIAAREAAARLLGMRPAEVTVEVGDGGAPIARAAAGEVLLSISHSGSLAVAVASHGPAVGIDIEKVRPSEVWQSELAFSVDERVLLAAAREAGGWQIGDVGLVAWTAKEASWKALRGVEPEGPAEVEVVEITVQSATRGDGFAMVETRGSLRERGGALVASVSLSRRVLAEERYVMAVVERIDPCKAGVEREDAA